MMGITGNDNGKWYRGWRRGKRRVLFRGGPQLPGLRRALSSHPACSSHTRWTSRLFWCFISGYRI